MQRLQRILCFWVSAALMLTLAACGGTPAPSATATPQTRAVVDMDQTHVELTVDGTPRILTCTAVSTMTVLMLGGPEARALTMPRARSIARCSRAWTMCRC